MFARKLEKLGAYCRRHHQPAMLDALSPAQQVGRLQGIEHVTPLLLLVGHVIVLAATHETVKFLIVVLDGVLAALARQNLLAGTDVAQAAGLVGAARRGHLAVKGVLPCRSVLPGFVVVIEQAVDEPDDGSTHHQYRQ